MHACTQAGPPTASAAVGECARRLPEAQDVRRRDAGFRRGRRPRPKADVVEQGAQTAQRVHGRLEFPPRRQGGVERHEQRGPAASEEGQERGQQRGLVALHVDLHKVRFAGLGNAPQQILDGEDGHAHAARARPVNHSVHGVRVVGEPSVPGRRAQCHVLHAHAVSQVLVPLNVEPQRRERAPGGLQRDDAPRDLRGPQRHGADPSADVEDDGPPWPQQPRQQGDHVRVPRVVALQVEVGDAAAVVEADAHAVLRDAVLLARKARARAPQHRAGVPEARRCHCRAPALRLVARGAIVEGWALLTTPPEVT
mmetsp:Transcript_15912/g.50080  ORF Transcript_15912/g.50080 Transcript_15912/m.50080 type:complete len:310 (+) Transcript_15912:23-952(+)